MAGQWQWSLRTWVVWMPLAVAIILTLAIPELHRADNGDPFWFCQAVWTSLPAALAAGAIMRAKFPKRLIAFWMVVGLTVTVFWIGFGCFTCHSETLPHLLAGLGQMFSTMAFLQVRASIAAALVGGLLALWIFPAKVQD